MKLFPKSIVFVVFSSATATVFFACGIEPRELDEDTQSAEAALIGTASTRVPGIFQVRSPNGRPHTAYVLDRGTVVTSSQWAPTRRVTGGLELRTGIDAADGGVTGTSGQASVVSVNPNVGLSILSFPVPAADARLRSRAPVPNPGTRATCYAYNSGTAFVRLAVTIVSTVGREAVLSAPVGSIGADDLGAPCIDAQDRLVGFISSASPQRLLLADSIGAFLDVAPTLAFLSTSGGVGPYELRVGASCLDLVSSQLGDNAGIGLVACNNGSNQRWYAQPGVTVGGVGQGSILRNEATGTCLDVPNASTAPGVVIQAYSCRSTANQSWFSHSSGVGTWISPLSAPLAPPTTPGPFGTQVPSLCLNVRAGGQVEQAACTTALSQQWTLVP